MEILLSIVISSLTEVIKKISKKLGVENTRKATAGILIIFCGIAAYLYSNGIITQEMIQDFVKLALMAAGWYELVYQRIIIPVFNKVFNQGN
jgi:hypothetical protein